MAPKNSPLLTDFSHELLCHILQYLPLKKLLSISMLCKKLRQAVNIHLRLCKEIDLCEGKVYDYMPSTITDDHMHALLKKCRHLETVYGLHPLKVERRRLRKRSALTVPGIIEALCLCCCLKSVETSDLRLLEAIMHHLPQVDIIGHFQNRDSVFPPHASHRLKLLPYPRISSLHLVGVEVPELTAMPHLQHLHLQCVRFTKLQPFRAFLAHNLKTFVMKHCMGPSLSLRYLSLIIALSSSPSLSRLELVRVPLPGGLFQRAVEDSYRHNGFVNLKTLVISGCKGVLESDLGHLMIVSSKNLESVSIQPSLTRDSLFVSLSFAACEFPKLKSLHLGYVDKLNAPGEWTNDTLLSIGLAEVPDTPSSLTDSGMKVISQLFPNIKNMSVSNCPHLMAMDQWSAIDGEQQVWKELTDLTLQRCHCLQLPSFALFLAFLPKIEVVLLNDMFREPPKGCSHVGLSAGTGLGMSSAVVSNQDEHIAVQGHHQEFELHPDDHADNEAMEDEFIDGDNMENPDQHIMVLQQEFFDEENQIARAPQREDGPAGNVPENQIRRELNADYREESNESSPASSSDDEKGAGWGRNSDCYCRRVNQKRRKKLRYSTECSSSGEEASPKRMNPRKKRLRLDDGTQGPAAGKTKKECHHEKKCRKNCSKGFDPNKPSTSKDGNCPDCRCGDSEMPLAAEPKDNKRSSAQLSSDNEPIRKKSNLDKETKIAGYCNSEHKCCNSLTRVIGEMPNTCNREPEPSNRSVVENTEKLLKDERSEKSLKSKYRKQVLNSCGQEPDSLSQDDEHLVEKDECCSPLTNDQAKMLHSHEQVPESLNKSDIRHFDKKLIEEGLPDEKSENCTLTGDQSEALPFASEEPESTNLSNTEQKENISNSDSLCDQRKTSKEPSVVNEGVMPILHGDSDCRPTDSNIIEEKDRGIISDFRGRTKSEPSPKESSVMPNEVMEYDASNDLNINCDRSVEMEFGPVLNFFSQKNSAENVENDFMECSETNGLNMKSDTPVEMEVQVECATEGNNDTNHQNCDQVESESGPVSPVLLSDKETAVTSQDELIDCCENNNPYISSEPPAIRESETVSVLQMEIGVKQNTSCDHADSVPAESSSLQEKAAREKSAPSCNGMEENPRFPSHLPPETLESSCEGEAKRSAQSSEEGVSKNIVDRSNNTREPSPEARLESNNLPIQETIVVQDDAEENYELDDHNYCSRVVDVKSEPESDSSSYSEEDEPDHRDSGLHGIYFESVRIKSEPESPPPSPSRWADQEAGPSRRTGRGGTVSSTEVKSECESAADSPPECLETEPEVPRRRHTRIIDCHCCFEIKSECESGDSCPENGDAAVTNDGSQAQADGASSPVSGACAVQEGTQTPRKRNPPRICKRASRALTKRQKRRIGRSGYNLVSQGTQATSADIRRSLRRVRSCSRRAPESSGTNTVSRSNKVSCRQVIKRSSHPKPNVVTHNKSTSTSDPLMEDDAVQTLRLVSETLISLTIISCGISDVVIDHCHSLTHVEVQACRILKMFQLHYCPALKRIGISQCPKLLLESITPEVVSLVATRKMIIYYEPCMQKYSSPRCEKAVFSKTPLDQGIILFQDYTSVNNESQQAAFKEYLLKWMEVVQKLYYSPMLAKHKKKKTKPKEIKSKYPYGHSLIRIHGVYTLPHSIDPTNKTWRYQILTNDHVFASALEKVPWDKGFPPPDIAEDYREDSALLSMIETELHEKNLKTQKKLTTFYIPTYENTDCDL